MCGIAGFVVAPAGMAEQEMLEVARAMSDAIPYRGPDSDGQWADAAGGAALGHRRLAIIDLSPAGHQPMRSSCGRFVICYNGEVYNFPELRTELEAAGRRFRGHSDTEVIVEGCAEWGIEATLRRLIGMFVFALWDCETRTLHLARDRLGIKPLYYLRQGELLAFGSELKVLRACPGWEARLEPASALAYMRLSYVPTPTSIFKDVRKLGPGELLVYRHGAAPRIERYWSMEEVARDGLADRFTGSDREATDALESILTDAVGRRMVADVPLGAFLSGGIDSSAVVALMQAQSTRPVRSFSIGFREEGYDEAQHARAVAEHLGTEHTELYVAPEHAREVIPRLPDMYDEPFADSSQIPTFLVSELARTHVTVSLSGDGGDELFAGYRRYFAAESMTSYYEPVPLWMRRSFATLVTTFSPGFWNTVFAAVPSRWRPQRAGDKVHKLARMISENRQAFYRRLISHIYEPGPLVPGVDEPRGILWDDRVEELVPEFVERLQYLDTVTYLPDDILTKVDRASMAVSLEARVPLLDHRVVEFAWRLPLSMKIRRGKSKWILCEVLYRHVPRELIERPKMGFGVPIDAWLRGPLREWAEDLLDARRMREEGLLDPEPIGRLWAAHLSGSVNNADGLWNVLMFQAWRRRWC